jgi:hypothetical protein
MKGQIADACGHGCVTTARIAQDEPEYVTNRTNGVRRDHGESAAPHEGKAYLYLLIVRVSVPDRDDVFRFLYVMNAQDRRTVLKR